MFKKNIVDFLTQNLIIKFYCYNHAQLYVTAESVNDDCPFLINIIINMIHPCMCYFECKTESVSIQSYISYSNIITIGSSHHFHHKQIIRKGK